MSHLRTNHLPATRCHVQTNGKAERLSKKILAKQRRYMAEHQRDWDIVVQQLTYEYIAKVHRSTNLRCFSVVLSPQQPSVATSDNPTALPTNATANKSMHTARARLLHRLSTMRQEVDNRMKKRQRCQKCDHTRLIHSALKAIEVGQYVHLVCPPMSTFAKELLNIKSYNQPLSVKK